jgi:ribosomal protein L21E
MATTQYSHGDQVIVTLDGFERPGEVHQHWPGDTMVEVNVRFSTFDHRLKLVAVDRLRPAPQPRPASWEVR